MESLCFVTFCLVLASSFNFGQGAGWTYSINAGEHGPGEWATDYPQFCNGNAQSPINLLSSAVLYDSDMESFTFSNFDTTSGITMTLLNNGHTAQVTFGGSTALQVSGGSLGGTYQVAQFHFHWGSDNTKGSEHTVDGNAYPMEVHIVCFNTQYGDLSSALSHSDGLAVLGFFFEVASSDNPTMEKITSELSKVMYTGNTTSMAPFALTDMMAGYGDYYRYKGGLTTPTCNEIVTWTVFKNTIKISNAQLAQFRALQDSHNHAIVDNYRPVQPLNSRSITASFKDDNFLSASASGLLYSSLALVSSLVLSLVIRL